MSAENKTPLLDVRDLRVEFRTPIGVVHAVDGFSYQLFENEIVGIVGESGCGKSASQLAVMQLLQSPPGFISGGEVIFDGKDLARLQAQRPGDAGHTRRADRHDLPGADDLAQPGR